MGTTSINCTYKLLHIDRTEDFLEIMDEKSFHETDMENLIFPCFFIFNLNYNKVYLLFYYTTFDESKLGFKQIFA